MNLKLALMELGNKLVSERGYHPGWDTRSPRSTKPIVDFTKFLNECPEAQEILSDMGIDWPVIRKAGGIV